MNIGNLAFYEKMELSKFEEFARILGLYHGKDVKEVYPLLKDKKHLLELGAGYGRVIQALLDLGFQGRITAIEQVPRLVSRLKERFKDQVQVVQQDLRALEVPGTVDGILWFWSGILELDTEEQLAVIKRCHHLLEKGGLLIVEAPMGEPQKVGKSSGKLVRVETEWGVLEAYLTGHDEMEHFYKEAGFAMMEEVTYQTDVGITRIFYILRK